MSTEQEQENVEQNEELAVSEQTEVQATETETPETHEPTMVPLAALQAERKKRQELEYLIQQNAANKPAEQPIDPTGLVENQRLMEVTAETKREILETLYQDINPKAVQDINKYLEQILEKKPWLAASVDSAQNRYARAHEIVQDYKHLVEAKPASRVTQNTDGQRIIQNSQKPRSPVEIGKAAQPAGVEYLKSIQGTPEFREYRKKLRAG